MSVSRRQLLASGAGLAGLLAAGRAPAAIVREAARPATLQGVSSGDVSQGRAIIWSRTDRPARMLVEWSTSERFADATLVRGPDALETTDFTAKLDLGPLPLGERIYYRVQWQDLGDLKTLSEPATGSLVMPPAADAAHDLTVVFTGDVCGQGWGIDPARGGLSIFETMRRAQPDLFIHLGDSIYADGPITAEVPLDDGSVWRNITTPEKSSVAQTLEEFRGNYRYNLLDENVRRFNAEVAQIVLWDDHETHNNWYPTGQAADPRYSERSSAMLAARARAAFLEYQPIRHHWRDRERIYRQVRCGPLLDVFAWDMRSYRGANSANRQAKASAETAILGASQLAWLKRRLQASTATWKVIASDMPLGLVVADGQNFEAVANRDDGPPLGRELEIADLLRFIKVAKITGVLFLTADVHYAAAHYYNPAQAKFAEFQPFWEFVAGPAHAGTFGPGQLDATFGPQLKFLSIPPGMKPNRSPAEGFQFFGTLQIAARTKVLTASLSNAAGKELFTVDLEPA